MQMKISRKQWKSCENGCITNIRIYAVYIHMFSLLKSTTLTYLESATREENMRSRFIKLQ